MIPAFYSKIDLGEEETAFLAAHPMAPQTYQTLEYALLHDTAAFTKAIQALPRPRAAFLQFSVQRAQVLKPAFDAQAIPESVYYDTFRDLGIWAADCRHRFGEIGIDDMDWIVRSLQMQLFRLGRLQFQPSALPYACRAGDYSFPQGTLCLNVHIPAGLPLDPAACQSSYRAAARFFRAIPPVFFCVSWLLSPELERLLPAGSKIRSFRQPYRLQKLLPGSRQAEERLFFALRQNPADYPADTALRAAARTHLLQGGRLGSAAGLFVLSEQV